MPARSRELKQEYALARQELVRICKAVLISNYDVVLPKSQQIIQMFICINGSSGKTVRNQVRVCTRIQASGYTYTTGVTSERSIELLEKVLSKYGWATRKILGKDPIRVTLKRSPTEEEKDWAGSVYENNGVSTEGSTKVIYYHVQAEIKVRKYSSDKSLSMSDYVNSVMSDVITDGYISGHGREIPNTRVIVEESTEHSTEHLYEVTMADQESKDVIVI